MAQVFAVVVLVVAAVALVAKIAAATVGATADVVTVGESV